MDYRALVIFNDETLRTLMAEMLRFVGFEVITVRNGTEALRHIESRLPELIVLDIAIPDISGLHLLEQVRAHEGGASVTIVLSTGDPRIRQFPQAALADVLLMKPFHPQDLEALARRLYQSVIDTKPDGRDIRRKFKRQNGTPPDGEGSVC